LDVNGSELAVGDAVINRYSKYGIPLRTATE
jgi:hypothetical protein